MSFKEDRLQNEKNDPQESSSLTFINVPIFLIAALLGFGATYLGLRTKNTDMSPGDSRTTAVAVQAAPVGTGNDLASVMTKGKQVYTTTCQACHQATGLGIPGAFPSLSESEWVNGPPKQFVAIVLHGLQGSITVKGLKFQGAMPAFGGQLKADDIAAVTTYVRNSFNNKSDAIAADLVNEVKEETKAKTTAWDGEAELKTKVWQ